MNGVLRINSTYTTTTRPSHAGPKVRAEAPAVPTAMPATVETIVSTIVKIRPCRSTFQ
jgi:hypothetical protein